MQIKSAIKNKKTILFLTHHPYANPLAIAQLEEFKELSWAAGLQCTKILYQVIKRMNPATLIGAGKIQELKDTLLETGSQVIVFNHPLSGVQTRNLEKQLDVIIIDRNQLILDIFAQRAKTYAGKLQVELARALDELPRMVGAWMSSLSRQGGGIGAKGPGEKAIEIDRRQVQVRSRKIRQKLEKIRRVRRGHRALRKKNNIPTVALIGYTNSGKSTLLNALTENDSAAVKDLLFMTLDPTTRKVNINKLQNVLVTDTVGFIQDLSPHLIEAFKATLEESEGASILLHVVDLSSPLMKAQIDTVNKLINEFGWNQKPCIHVYNKIDTAPKEKVFEIQSSPKVFVSALNKIGLDKLKQTIEEEITRMQTEEVQLYFPKNKEEKIYALDRKALIYKKEISSMGILCYARMRLSQTKEWEDFIIKKTS